MITLRRPIRAPASTTQWGPIEASSPTLAPGETMALGCTPGAWRSTSGRKMRTTRWNAR